MCVYVHTHVTVYVQVREQPVEAASLSTVGHDIKLM